MGKASIVYIGLSVVAASSLRKAKAVYFWITGGFVRIAVATSFLAFATVCVSILVRNFGGSIVLELGVFSLGMAAT